MTTHLIVLRHFEHAASIWRRGLAAAALALAAPLVLAQVVVPADASLQTPYAQEDKDWAVPPEPAIRKTAYHAPTPASLPGARVIRTLQLKALLGQPDARVVVIDVLNARRDGRPHKTVPGALWLPGAGNGDFYGAEKSRYAKALEAATGGDKARPLVFLCLSAECWLSWNAALRALEAGYTDVLWYRGGTDAWHGASLDLAEVAATPW